MTFLSLCSAGRRLTPSISKRVLGVQMKAFQHEDDFFVPYVHEGILTMTRHSCVGATIVFPHSVYNMTFHSNTMASFLVENV